MDLSGKHSTDRPLSRGRSVDGLYRGISSRGFSLENYSLSLKLRLYVGLLPQLVNGNSSRSVCCLLGTGDGFKQCLPSLQRSGAVNRAPDS